MEMRKLGLAGAGLLVSLATGCDSLSGVNFNTNDLPADTGAGRTFDLYEGDVQQGLDETHSELSLSFTLAPNEHFISEVPLAGIVKNVDDEKSKTGAPFKAVLRQPGGVGSNFYEVDFVDNDNTYKEGATYRVTFTGDSFNTGSVLERLASDVVKVFTGLNKTTVVMDVKYKTGNSGVIVDQRLDDLETNGVPNNGGEEPSGNPFEGASWRVYERDSGTEVDEIMGSLNPDTPYVAEFSMSKAAYEKFGEPQISGREEYTGEDNCFIADFRPDSSVSVAGDEAVRTMDVYLSRFCTPEQNQTNEFVQMEARIGDSHYNAAFFATSD